MVISFARHPQTDRQTETVNKCLETYLRCMILNCPSSWNEGLPLAEWWNNTKFHSSTQHPRRWFIINHSLHMAYLPGENNVTSIDRFLQNREEMIRILQFNLSWAQQKRKIPVDKHRTDRQFAVGEWVWLKTQTYEQMTIKNMESNEKLSPKYLPTSNRSYYWASCL